MTTTWYPYTQIKTAPKPLTVLKAQNCKIETKEKGVLIDAISSWWCVIHGYNNPVLNKALENQLKKVAHVMLGGLTHESAEKLSQKLVEITPKGLNHVFYSDSGSVGIEVALKMAVQYFKNNKQVSKTKFVCFKKAYHGDTMGAMSVCDPDEGMHKIFTNYFPKQFLLPAPPKKMSIDLNKDDNDFLDILKKTVVSNRDEIAAVIIEPIVQAAGGFNIYNENILVEIKQICQENDILLILDEVATGFGRTGKMFASNHADITPDIMVLGKGLTAGYSGHAATLATSEIFKSFYHDNELKAFMHGPTFMGNPLACQVALKNIEIFETQKIYSEKLQKLNQFYWKIYLSYKAP